MLINNDLTQDVHQGGKNIVIVSHQNPDGDAIGSSLGLMHYLLKKKHLVQAIMPGASPDFLQWLPGSDSIVLYDKKSKQARRLIKEAEYIFCLDFNEMSRTDKMGHYLKEATGKKIMIDHHPFPKLDQFDIVFSNTEVSSTCELVYQFIDNLGDKDLINKDIAEALYTGIMTDTGSFSYSCKHEGPFLITAELIKAGLDVRKVNDLVYNTNTEMKIRLLGHALNSCLTVLPDYRTAYIALDADDLQRYDYQPGDTEGLVNYALSIKGVIFAALFSYRKDLIRISFRSKNDFAVNEFAGKHFEGGGHRNAAGGNSFLSMDETLSKFLNLLDEYATQLRDK